MSKAKLTIKTPELETAKNALALADIKVLQVVTTGSEFNKVEVNYKTEQQIWDAGQYFKSLLADNKNESKNLTQNENVKQNKINKGSRNKQN